MAIWLVALVAAYVLFLGRGNPLDGALTALTQIVRGKRLTRTPADSTGFVDAEPGELAEEAGMSLEAYAAARMIASGAIYVAIPVAMIGTYMLTRNMESR